MNEDRKKARRKIAALKKMTPKSGCSEAEAMAAAAKAAELMREHCISDAELGTEQHRAKSRTMGRGARDAIWVQLGRCTNTVVVIDASTREVEWIGKPHAAEIACYLFTVINRAIDAAIRDYKTTANYRRRRTVGSKRKAVHDFTLGMAHRIRRELYELFASIIDENERTQALEARDEIYASLCEVTPRQVTGRYNPAASLAGQRAGASVRLSHGLSGKAEEKRLGTSAQS